MGEFKPRETPAPEEFARLMEERLLRREGEAPGGSEIPPEMLEELEAAEELLSAAFRDARPAMGFAERVMAALPAPVAVAPLTQPVVVYSVRRPRRRVWLWTAAGAAAALAMLALCLAALSRRAPETPAAALVKGEVVDGAGRAAEKLEPERRYRVSGAAPAVLRTGAADAESPGMVRLAQDTEFELPRPREREAVRLHHGLLYAYEPGRRPMVVQSPALEAEVAGVSMVVQEVRPAEGPGEHGWGQALVMVLHGRTRVREAAGGEVTMNAGELYVTGFACEPAEEFAALAPVRAQGLEDLARDPRGRAEQRQLYLRTVEGYTRDLRELEGRLKRLPHGASPDRARLEERRALVRRLLDEHRRSLVRMPETRGEEPMPRARRLRRAVEQIRKGREEYQEPNNWL